MELLKHIPKPYLKAWKSAQDGVLQDENKTELEEAGHHCFQVKGLTTMDLDVFWKDVNQKLKVDPKDRLCLHLIRSQQLVGTAVDNVLNHAYGRGFLLVRSLEEDERVRVEVILGDKGPGFLNEKGEPITISDAVVGNDFNEETGRNHIALGENIVGGSELITIAEVHQLPSGGKEGSMYHRKFATRPVTTSLDTDGMEAGTLIISCSYLSKYSAAED